MGITERKERQKAELRDTILAAARRIFSEEGAEALTMRRIAEAIEYSPATIYLYFASREEIAMRLVAEGMRTLVERFEPTAAIADPVDRLHALGEAYVDFGITDPQTYKLIFMQDPKYVYSVFAPAETAGSDQNGRRAFDALASTIGEAVERGMFAPVDAARAAEAFWAALHGIVSLHITCPIMIPDAVLSARLIARLLIDGMRA